MLKISFLRSTYCMYSVITETIIISLALRFENETLESHVRIIVYDKNWAFCDKKCTVVVARERKITLLKYVTYYEVYTVTHSRTVYLAAPTQSPEPQRHFFQKAQEVKRKERNLDNN
jgi:hypothetical protein